ncbi:ArsR/SmtB family transcription factor [Sinomonas soli]
MVTDIFAVIADRTRRDILDTLRTGDKAVGELVEALAASQPTVSKHLKVLRDAGLVTTRAQGQKRFYALRLEPLDEVGGWLAGLRTTAPSPAAAVAPAAAAGPVQDEAPPAEPAAPSPRRGEEAALVPAAVVPAPAERLEARPEGSRPAQIQRTVERAAARATELMANLPKFGRRK